MLRRPVEPATVQRPSKREGPLWKEEPQFSAAVRPTGTRALFLEGRELAGASQHFVDFVQMQLFLNNHFSSVFIQSTELPSAILSRS